MTSAITDGPNTDYSFGYNFNYGVWLPDTVVTLCNVPWNNDYRDIVQFPLADGTTLDQYIDSLETPIITIDNMMYVRPNQPVKLNLPINKVNLFNYIRVSNPAQPITPADTYKPFYYFILQAQQVAPNMTEVIVQLDLWQTFGSEVTFGNCYIERGHIGIANENAFNNNGRDYLTVPEGLDYGGEYRIIKRTGYQVMKVANYGMTADDLNFNDPGPDNYGSTCGVLGISTTDIEVSPGTVDAPNLVTATGNSFEGIPSGASIWYWPTINNFLQFMEQNQDTPWVTQGILSVTIIPNLRRYDAIGMFDSAALTAAFYAGDARLGGEIWNIQPFVPAPVITPVMEAWRESDDILNAIPTEYQILKKFLTYPYMVIEMTNFTGKPIILKPESWADDDATIVEVATFTAPNQRIVFYPRRYNALPDSDIDDYGGYNSGYDWYYNNPDTGTHDSLPSVWAEGGDDGGDFLDFSTMLDNFPTIALVNNGALSYLASNFASFPYQQQQAMWAQQRALQGAQTQYNQGNAGITASKENNALGNALAQQQVAVGNQNAINNQAIQGTAGVIAGLGGLISTDPSAAGLVSGVASDVVGSMVVNNNTQTASQQVNNSTNVSRLQNQVTNRQAGYVNDTNLGYAQYAAAGDYAIAIQGINAQIQGASMVQPTTSGQQGGDTFNLVQGKVGINLRFKLIDNASLRTVGNFWLRYGYAVNQFSTLPSNLLCMSKFAYWKLRETYLVSSTIPEAFKQGIRGIFEKGVTVWADPSFIGTTALSDNEIVSGFTL